MVLVVDSNSFEGQACRVHISSKDIESEREKEKLKTLRMNELLLLLYVLDPTRTATVAHYFRYFMTKEKWRWS